jgi:NADH-quinone oxidoreductase subunit K
MPVTSFVAISFLLFSIGVAGVLTRRDAVVVLTSIQLILSAATLNLVAFARYWQLRGVVPAHAGEVFAVVVIVVAAAHAALGVGLAVVARRGRGTDGAGEVDALGR